MPKAKSGRRPVVCHEDARIIEQWPIRIIQDGIDNFTVTYGLQVDSGLSYGQACCKYGQAIMHALSCEGKVDNRTKGER